MAKLRIGSGEGERVFELEPSSTIGRGDQNTIQLSDPLVSRAHAVIERSSDGSFMLEDVGSRHGTYVSGQRVSKVHLENGDTIVIGSTAMRFEHESSKDSTKAPEELLVMRRHLLDVAPAFRPEHEYQDVSILRRDFEHLRVAYEISRAIGALTSLDDVLEAILDAAFHLLEADRGAILLKDDSGELALRLSRRSDGCKERIVVSTSILREVIDTKSGIVCADAGRDVRFGGAVSIQAQALRSTMTVPLLYKDEILGVLHLDSQTAYGVFGEKDLELFASLASQAAIAIKSAHLARRAQDEARRRERLQRFLPPSLVDQLMRGGLELGTSGKLHEVTVFFLDIRGFTRLSESEPPESMVEMLNVFFEIMLDILFLHRGTFDKYIGDEIMALFGVPVRMPDAPDRAVACALDMRRALRTLNIKRAMAGKPPIETGIGIHTGEAVCGAIGSRRTMQYTAIGDTVNTAARMCSAASPGDILISKETASRLTRGFKIEPLPPLRLKGKRYPIEVARVLDDLPTHGDVTLA